MTNSRVSARLLTLSLCALLWSTPAGWAAAKTIQAPPPPTGPVHVTLLQLNDVYDLKPVDKGEHGGLARVATLIRRIEAENPNTFFVLAGDTLSPSIASRVFKGQQMVAAWNAMGLDLAVLGNHEYDFGSEVLRQRIAESKFPWLGSNVIDGATGQPADGSVISHTITVEGIRLGFFGVLTADTLHGSHPASTVRFDDPIGTACKVVTALRVDGANVVIGITHLSMNEDKQVARQLTYRRVAALRGGHEHTVLQGQAGGVPIFKVGSDARQLGRLDLWIDRESKTVQSMDWQLIPVDKSIPEDPAVAAVVNQFEGQLQAALDETIGTASVQLDAVQEHNRHRETNLGNFIADAYRKLHNADVGLVNGGSIRSNTTYGPGAITRRDIQTLMPFGNHVMKVSLSGALLKEALENGVSRLGDEEAGRFLQVSGMTYAYDGRKPPGSRVSQILIGGKPLDLKKSYTAGISDYLVNGGDDFLMLKAAKALTDDEMSPTDSATLEEAIQKAGSISPAIEGRIKRLD